MADPREWADAFVAQASEDLVTAQAAFEKGAVSTFACTERGEQLHRALAGVPQGHERHRRLAGVLPTTGLPDCSNTATSVNTSVALAR